MPFKKNPPLYHVWQSMRGRCRNPNYRQWSDYGGRGIKISPRWESFALFVQDMGERPPGYSLDRIDNDGDYEPSNCKWSSRKEQQRNQRRTLRIRAEGKTFTAIELAEKAGVKVDTIMGRVSRGLSLSEIISAKKFRNDSGLKLGGAANGERQRAKTHCRHGHEYSTTNTYITPKGWRTCRTCHAAKTSRQRRNAKK